MVQLFRGRGLNVTPQRECLFGVLYGVPIHPTAEVVHAEVRRHMPSVSLKTVYQTLHDLAEMGEIQELDLGTGSTRFDPNVEAHHHLVCSQCGKVRDLYAEVRMDIPDADRQGFSIGSVEVVFRGLCATCAEPTAVVAPTHRDVPGVRQDRS